MLKSPLKFLEIGKKLNKDSSSLTQVVSKKIKNAILKSRKIDKDVFLKNKKKDQKRKEKQKRLNKEKKLEGKSILKNINKPLKNVQKRAKNFFQSMIEVISLILIGWMINKLHKIIEQAKKFKERIESLVENLKSAFKNSMKFVQGIAEVISGTVENIKNLDFNDSQGKLTDAMNKMTNSFGLMKSDLSDAALNVRSFSDKNFQEILKIEDSDIPNKKGERRKVTTQSVREKYFTSGLASDYKQTEKEAFRQAEEYEKNKKLNVEEEKRDVKKEVKKEETKVDLKSTINNTINGDNIKTDLSTITFDGKTYPNGNKVERDIGGKGDSTYQDRSVTVTKSTSTSKKIELTTHDPNAFNKIISQREDRLDALRKLHRTNGPQIVNVEIDVSKIQKQNNNSTGGGTQVVIVEKDNKKKQHLIDLAK